MGRDTPGARNAPTDWEQLVTLVLILGLAMNAVALPLAARRVVSSSA